ncbi:hypothetical protein GCM10018777_67560 [Streptomyces albogriseolus]|nr:hypothetical protein GCM10018777_67560 [Streptomyces viridodiastaticus]
MLSDGIIYFGERAVAAEYAGPTGVNFAMGMVKYATHPSSLEEFGEYAKCTTTQDQMECRAANRVRDPCGQT